jgi:hypothetical protein
MIHQPDCLNSRTGQTFSNDPADTAGPDDQYSQSTNERLRLFTPR